jgi:hypothetical protein
MVSVMGNHVMLHRASYAQNWGPYFRSAVVIARSSHVSFIGNVIAQAYDYALSIEPDTTFSQLPTGNITIAQNVFRYNRYLDVFIGFDGSPMGGAAVLPTGVAITGNTFMFGPRAFSALDSSTATISLRYVSGRQILISGNTWTADPGSCFSGATSPRVPNVITLYGFPPPGYCSDIVVSNNVVNVGGVFFMYISSYIHDAAVPVRIADNQLNLGGLYNMFEYDAAAAHTNSSLYVDERGAGDPNTLGISAGPGSRWSRADGGAGSSFYIKESTGTTGWVAK